MTPPSPPCPTSPVTAIQAALDEGRFLTGVVTLAASHEKVLAVCPAGSVDPAASAPMAENTLFWVASQTKPITAAAVMMLVDEGRVALDDPLEKYLPEFAGQRVAVEADAGRCLLGKPAAPPTLRQALSNTSGLPFSARVEQPTLDALPLRTAALAYSTMALEFEPGSAYRYSNAGFNAAGRVIEVVTGQAYEHFLQARLFDPLGMADTTFWPTEEQASRLAAACRPGPAGGVPQTTLISQLSYPVTDRLRRFPFPGGGLFSTARDCAQFCRMILGGGELDGRRYLSAEAVREMASRQTPAGCPDDYGLGWQRQEGGRFGHGGALASHMEIDPLAGLVTVFLVQIVDAQGCTTPLLAAWREEAAARYGAAPR